MYDFTDVQMYLYTYVYSKSADWVNEKHEFLVNLFLYPCISFCACTKFLRHQLQMPKYYVNYGVGNSQGWTSLLFATTLEGP
jgi:hypothetical protein